MEKPYGGRGAKWGEGGAVLNTTEWPFKLPTAAKKWQIAHLLSRGLRKGLQRNILVVFVHQLAVLDSYETAARLLAGHMGTRTETYIQLGGGAEAKPWGAWKRFF